MMAGVAPALTGVSGSSASHRRDQLGRLSSMGAQWQGSLHYPGRGFRYDTVRLVGLEVDEWMKLRSAVARSERQVECEIDIE